jgi:site-specific DNA-methyltransferase (adenine-specific)/adenine-specific DNA-methyltransferase
LDKTVLSFTEGEKMLTKNDLSYLIECLQEGNKIPEEYKYDLFPSINQEVEINFSGKMRKEDILSDTDEVTNVPFQLDKEFGTEDDKWSNKLIFGDNLQILKSLYYNTDPLIRDEIKGKVQLIYIDPPFATDRDFSSNGGAKAYSDKVKGAEFLEFLRRRLYLLREMLSETGLIYLHLDYRYVHYVKVIMDEIFGESTFVNEITWKRTSAHNDSGKYGINTEYILVYSKTGNYKWNVQYKQYSKKYLDRYRKSDPDGRKWTDGSLSAKGLSGGGYTYTFNGIEGYWRCPITTMKQYEKDNKLYYTSKGGIRIKKYLDKMLGIPLQALWDDIDPLNSQSKERVKYPTQKPEELLKRIILSCTNEGDLVMDCFAGSGTTLVTAEKLGRRWIGCDIGKLSMYVIQKRLLNIEHSPNIKTYKGKYKQRASNFQMLTAGLYDLSKVFSLSENDYISFVMDLFDVSPLKGAQINGIRVEGKKRDKFVKIYPYWEPEMRDADINE